MRKILYIHGLSSSGNSNTVNTLRQLLPNDCILAPDLPIEPIEALEMLRKLCSNESPSIVIGTSMGGMFAQQLHGYRKILVNPAFHVSDFMKKNIGIQPFFNSRVDGATSYEITQELCDSYAKLESNQFVSIKPFDVQNTYALFGINDELVDCSQEYLKYYKHKAEFDGGHRLSHLNIEQIIVPLVDSILNQELKL